MGCKIEQTFEQFYCKIGQVFTVFEFLNIILAFSSFSSLSEYDKRRTSEIQRKKRRKSLNSENDMSPSKAKANTISKTSI
jgi:hypothetical protein